MAKTIGTAGSSVVEILHPGCGKLVARVVNGVLQVYCARRGCREWVPLPGWFEVAKLRQVFELIASGSVGLDQIICLGDPFAPYRQIEDLLFLGPAEWDKAVRGPKGENPLELADDWCPQVPLPDAWTVDLWIRQAALCRDPKRDYLCTPVLWLALPEVVGIPTSLVGQNKLWGVADNNLPAGRVRQQMYSNYFVPKPEDHPFAQVPAVAEPTWMAGFVDFPRFTTSKSWKLQKQVAQERGLAVSIAPRDALMLNLLSAALDMRFRTATWARTANPCGGAPLDVDFGPPGLRVDRVWFPGDDRPDVGAGLEGIPLELVA